MAGQLKKYEEHVENGHTLDPPAVARLLQRRKVREQDIERIDACLRKHSENKKMKGEANDNSREVEAVCITG